MKLKRVALGFSCLWLLGAACPEEFLCACSFARSYLRLEGIVRRGDVPVAVVAVYVITEPQTSFCNFKFGRGFPVPRLDYSGARGSTNAEGRFAFSVYTDFDPDSLCLRVLARPREGTDSVVVDTVGYFVGEGQPDTVRLQLQLP